MNPSENSQGQSVVEYLLLLFVVVSLTLTLINSPAFQSIMGEDSFFFTKLREKQEYTFRHTHFRDGADDSNYTDSHHSYQNPDSGQSRFFAPTTAYP